MVKVYTSIYFLISSFVDHEPFWYFLTIKFITVESMQFTIIVLSIGQNGLYTVGIVFLDTKLNNSDNISMHFSFLDNQFPSLK